MDRVQDGWRNCLIAGVLAISAVAGRAQAPGVADGLKLQFEVASIRPDDPNAKVRTIPNVDLDSSGLLRYQGGPVVMDGDLMDYLIFAYKLRNRGEYWSLNARLPKWAQFQSGHSYTVQARPGELPGGREQPTKDDLRAMMRTLLAERFGLEVHTETQPQLAWVLVRTAAGANGKTRLQPHTGVPLCTAMSQEEFQRLLKERKPDELPPVCGTMVLREKEGPHLIIRDLTMPEIAGELGLVSGNRDGLDTLPQVDGTGLQGRYDLDFRFFRRPPAAAAGEAVVDQGPDLLQALAAEGGLEFKKKTVPVQMLMVDKVHEPTPD